MTRSGRSSSHFGFSICDWTSIPGRLDSSTIRNPKSAIANRNGAPATNRQGYGLTEKDSATGLNHTWFRKNENRAGRWTSPDPYNGSASVGNPQSWNRYSYVENEPTNFVDPSGLYLPGSYCVRYHYSNPSTGEGFWGPWHCYGSGDESGYGIGGIGGYGGDPGLPGGGGAGLGVSMNPVQGLACVAALVFTILALKCIGGTNPSIACRALVEWAFFWWSFCRPGGTPPELPPPDDPTPPTKPEPPTKPKPKPPTKPKPKPKPKTSGFTDQRIVQRTPVEATPPGTARPRPRGAWGADHARVPWSGFGGGGDFGGAGAGGRWD